MGGIDRSKVKRSFSQKSDDYDSMAMVQQRVVNRFMQKNFTCCDLPEMLLDVGAGTGKLLKCLVELFPSAHAVGLDMAFGMATTARERLATGGGSSIVCGDGELLPFADGCFDMVVSTSTYQWLNPLDSAFSEVRRVLKPGGRFYFALFGEATLFELKASYREALRLYGAGAVDRSHDFVSRAEAEHALKRAGFSSCRVESELEIEMHADVPTLLRSLKGIGASNASASPATGLAGRRITEAMIGLYGKQYAGEGGVPATYEVLYGSGVRNG